MERKMWAHWVHPSNSKRGQAILELALFGSILIMLLGILVSYGMKYNFQQRVTQETFRKALGLAADPDRRSGSYVLLTDRHIANPADSFGLGSMAPFMSSASVTRNYKMHLTPNDADALPRLDIEIVGSPGKTVGSPPIIEEEGVYRYKTAAFRDEYNVHKDVLGYYQTRNGKYGDITSKDLCDDDSTYCYKDKKSKYDYIYGGRGMGWWITIRRGCDAWGSKCTGGSEEECTPDPDDPEDDCVCDYWCEGWSTYDIRILDSYAAQIVDYDDMKTRCYKISEAGIHTPWYCEQKDTLFAVDPLTGLPTVAFGLQSNYDQATTISNTLEKIESGSLITTTDTVDYQNTFTRSIVYSDNMDDLVTGESRSPAEGDITRTPDPVTSTTSITTQHIWEAAW